MGMVERAITQSYNAIFNWNPSLAPVSNNNPLIAELKRYGPEAEPSPPPSLQQSCRYCRRLAQTHYENFTVAGFLLPKRLRQHFCNIYAYCRWADDLADETGDPARSLALLDWWEVQLRDCYEGRMSHPVFVALAETIRRFEIPPQPFCDLLAAFRQDQRTTRYQTMDELLGYCRNSADPVGRLVLYLAGCHDRRFFECSNSTCSRGHRFFELSDSICTGLQLANFWQDVANDWDRGRIYLPADWRERFGYDESMFARRQCNDAFREMLAVAVDDAEQRLRAGLPLLGMVPREFRFPIDLFVRGGLTVLDAIRRSRYDVWLNRPS